MVFRLEDLCLRRVSRQIDVLQSRLGSKLTRMHKEALLERMASHSLLSPTNLPIVTYHLFSPQLKCLSLAYCNQVRSCISEYFYIFFCIVCVRACVCACLYNFVNAYHFYYSYT